MTTQQKRACCAGAPPKLVYIKVRGSPVRLVGIEPFFEQLYQAGRRDDPALEAELLAMTGGRAAEERSLQPS